MKKIFALFLLLTAGCGDHAPVTASNPPATTSPPASVQFPQRIVRG